MHHTQEGTENIKEQLSIMNPRTVCYSYAAIENCMQIVYNITLHAG
jgi:hypothetical protein